jgi:type I restriction enzyme S subunit
MNRREVKRAPVLRFKGFTNDWEQRKLKEVVNINPSTNVPNTFNYVDLNSVKGVSLIKVKKINKKEAPSRAQRVAKNGDIFYQMVRPYQKNNYLFNKPKTSFPYVFSTGYAQLRSIKTSPSYIFPLLQKSDFVNKVLAHSTGTSYPAINSRDLGQIKIYLPNELVEQNKIGEIFQKINKIIELQQRKLKLLKEIRKGIVENIRDNNFEYKEQKNDFKDVKIKDMFKITRGKVLPKEKISSNKISPNIYPVFSSQTLNNGLLGFYKDYLFQNAITWTTDGANAGTVNFRNEKFYSTNVNGVLLQKKIKPDLLTADLLNLVAFKYVSKVGNPKLMNNTMANIRIKIPSNTNARIFYSKILNKCDTKIDFINKKIDYLTTFKRFLLQNMFI